MSTGMRLLNTHTGRFVARGDSNGPTAYAILSHVWAREGEQSNQDLERLQSGSSRNGGRFLRSATVGRPERRGSILAHPYLSPKIKETCHVAWNDGYGLAWVESCRIDKTSSAELSESLNSMYEGYREADACYVYLVDVPDTHDVEELLAPDHVNTLSLTLQAATNIDIDISMGRVSISAVSAAPRMWWASSRQTRRVEDEAYSLIGIFGVHMYTVYCEDSHAFVPLQEEIFKTIPDHN
ncbi:hypothetical protein BD413DRAFT_637372 [Trametes elegans]|nr:hypothetical protein BD413DRAFT_637372 [Trametes elegans]